MLLFFACSTPKATLFIWSFHLLLGSGYKVSSASHTKHCFSRYLVPATLFFTCPGETFTSKKCLSDNSSYATLWLGHHRNTDAHREGEHNCGLIYRTNKPVEGKVSPTNMLSEVLQHLCNKLDERGNPYHG